MQKLTNNRTFILTLLALLGQLVFLFLHPETAATVFGSMPIILACYAGSSASREIGAYFAASRDPNSNTAQVIANVRDSGGTKNG
jgi:hypothetical protein